MNLTVEYWFGTSDSIKDCLAFQKESSLSIPRKRPREAEYFPQYSSRYETRYLTVHTKIEDEIQAINSVGDLGTVAKSGYELVALIKGKLFKIDVPDNYPFDPPKLRTMNPKSLVATSIFYLLRADGSVQLSILDHWKELPERQLMEDNNLYRILKCIHLGLMGSSSPLKFSESEYKEMTTRCQTAEYAVTEVAKNLSVSLKKVIRNHFKDKKNTMMGRVLHLIEEAAKAKSEPREDGRFTKKPAKKRFKPVFIKLF